VKGSGASFPTDRVYAVDEYTLSKLSKPVYWAAIPCKTLFVNRCMGTDKTQVRGVYHGGVHAPRKDTWTQHNLRRWSKLIVPGSNVIDIGANVGDTTVEMAIRAGRTIAFEAHPTTALITEAQAVINPKLNITVHPVAVADLDGSMQLNVDCNGCNAGPVKTRMWAGAVIQVPQVRLDRFLLRQYGLEFFKGVSFIKIDTEGYDKTLLRVLKPLLAIHRPKIWAEWFDPYWKKGGPNSISAGSRDLFAAISEIGYVPVHPVSRHTLTPENKNGVEDLLLLPNTSSI